MMAASSRSYHPKQNYRFLSGDQHRHYETVVLGPDSEFELDESDLYNSVSTRSDESPEFRNSRISKRPSSLAKRCDSGAGGGCFRPASLPVNIPDWSKILRGEYRDNRRRWEGDDNDDVEGDDWNDQGDGRVPPHEFLARTRIASFSVHEGIGRTLKGRDLTMVRNAILEKTGFLD
ncbi:hypothetical protein SLE2022_285330 [Rubroshorea leprosula]